MTFRVPVLAAVSALLAAAPATAQKQGSVEVGGFAQFTNHDNSLPLGDALGFGGRVAVHVLSVLSIEVDVAHASHNDATTSPMHFWLVYNVPPVSRAEFIVGAGIVRNSYGGAYDAKDNGIAGFVGVRHRLSDLFAIRLQGQTDFIANPANESQNNRLNGNWSIQLGVSALLNRNARNP